MKLKKPPDTLEDLKSVLSVISEIRKMSLGVELKYRDLQERYRTLAKYRIDVPQSEQELAVKIEADWKSLFDEAKQMDRNLVRVKKKFKQVCKTLGRRWAPGCVSGMHIRSNFCM